MPVLRGLCKLFRSVNQSLIILWHFLRIQLNNAFQYWYKGTIHAEKLITEKHPWQLLFVQMLQPACALIAFVNNKDWIPWLQRATLCLSIIWPYSFCETCRTNISQNKWSLLFSEKWQCHLIQKDSFLVAIFVSTLSLHTFLRVSMLGTLAMC